MNRRSTSKVCCKLIVTTVLMLLSVSAQAGNLDPHMLPKEGSGMPTMRDIYDQLDKGVTGSIPKAFIEPSEGPIVGTGKTLAEIQAKLPAADNANGAVVGNVLSGKTFWGLRTDGTWGLNSGTLILTGTANAADVLTGKTFTNADGSASGTMPDIGAATIIPGTSAKPIPAGYHNGSGAVAGDVNLVGENIRGGWTIFGVKGKNAVVDTTEPTSPATSDTISFGKKAFVNGGLVTGNRHGGYSCAGMLWGARWCDNLNGTVRDMTTGLVWLKNAHCTSNYYEQFGTKESWPSAKYWAETLWSGFCGLSDGSHPGDWRLPTKNELEGLANGPEPVRSGAPICFTGVQGNYYWTNTYELNIFFSWAVSLVDGTVSTFSNEFGGGPYFALYNMWAVRTGP